MKSMPWVLQNIPFAIFNWGSLLGINIALACEEKPLAVFFFGTWLYAVFTLLWCLWRKR